MLGGQIIAEKRGSCSWRFMPAMQTFTSSWYVILSAVSPLGGLIYYSCVLIDDALGNDAQVAGLLALPFLFSMFLLAIGLPLSLIAIFLGIRSRIRRDIFISLSLTLIGLLMTFNILASIVHRANIDSSTSVASPVNGLITQTSMCYSFRGSATDHRGDRGLLSHLR
jgi:hypothetical protein